MDASLKLGILLMAVDRLSGPINQGRAALDRFTGAGKQANQSLGRLQQTLNRVSTGMASLGVASTAAGNIALAGVKPAVSAFADLEEASTQLQNTLMGKDGSIPSAFAAIDARAKDLGNRLPGSTEDFYAMASSLKALGVSAEAVGGGALDATAYLGVVSKPLGVTYSQAAEAVAKFSQALGISQKDLVPFADTVQRAEHLGAGLTEMQYAFSRVAGPLKIVGHQGLQAANELAPLVAMLLRAGKTGEEAGTSLKKIFEVAIANGKFKDIKTLVADLEKYQKLKPAERQTKLTKVFGEDAAGVAGIIAGGGYQQIAAEMEAQASLNQRVENSLKTLTSRWEAFAGTAKNLAAVLGGSVSEPLKNLTTWLNDVTGKLTDWAAANPAMVGQLGQLGQLALTITAVGLTLGPVMVGLSALIRLATASPLIAAITLLATAALLIYQNWEPIKQFFMELWDGIAAAFISRWENIKAVFAGAWQVILDGASAAVAVFNHIAETISSSIGAAIDGIVAKWQAFTGAFSAAKDWVGGLFSSGSSVQAPKLPAVPAIDIASQIAAPQAPAIPSQSIASQIVAPKLPDTPSTVIASQIVAPKLPDTPSTVIASQIAAPSAPATPQMPELASQIVAPLALPLPMRGAAVPTFGGSLPAMGQPVKTLGGADGKKEKAEVGGLVRIQVDATTGQARVVEARSSNPNVPLSVDTGLALAGI